MRLYTASLEGVGVSASSPRALGSTAGTAGPSLGDAEGLVGDCLHGIGVALLGAGRYREACAAWERCAGASCEGFLYQGALRGWSGGVGAS